MSVSEPQTTHIRKYIGRNVFNTPPKISVVLLAHNNAEFLADALESVIGQKFREHEIIVVNDGSPDSDKLERAIKMRLEEITYIKQRKAGNGVARNTAIEHARGSIIAFLDGDNVWTPDFLASQYIFLQRHTYDMVYCDAALFGMHSAYRRTFMDSARSDGEANFDSILEGRCNVLTSGTMVRKSLIVEAGMFESGLASAHDFHLWLRIAKCGAAIGYQRKPLVKYRINPDCPPDEPVARLEHELTTLSRVRHTIDLTPEQMQVVERRVAGLETDIALEKGRSFLISGKYRDAALAFTGANKHHRSLKLTAMTLLSRLAPQALLKYYRSTRTDNILLLPRQN